MESPQPIETMPEKPSRRKRIHETIISLAKSFRRADEKKSTTWSRGDLAQLRRMEVKRPDSSELVFCRIVTQILEPAGLLTDHSPNRAFQQWVVILQGLATVHRFHDSSVPLGTALRRADVSDRRLARLLRAKDHLLWTEVRRLAHMLRSKGQPVRWQQVADLVLSDGTVYMDEVRRRIASEYYRERFKTDNPSNDNNH